jgi:hypothetical protein
MTSIPRHNAKEFFREFMETQSKILPHVLSELRAEGVITQPLSAAIQQYFAWYVEVTRPTFEPWDDSVPDWIRSSPSQSRGKKVYSNEATMAFMRMGYFFGEALREVCPDLYWAIGDRRTAYGTSPVLAGFAGGVECNTVIVCSVVMHEVHDGTANLEAFAILFETWKGNCK